MKDNEKLTKGEIAVIIIIVVVMTVMTVHVFSVNPSWR